MEARPIVELSRLIKKPIVPLLSVMLAAVPAGHAFAQGTNSAAADLQHQFNEGLEAYRKADYQKAIDAFGGIFTGMKDKTPESVLYCLGFSHYNLGHYDDASKVFRQYVEKYAQDAKAPEVQLFLGKALLQSGGDGDSDADKAKAEEALKYIKDAATKSPDLLESARFAAADAYIKKKDTKKAAEVLASAITEKISGPMLMRVSLQLVDLYIDSDQLPEASALLRKIEESASYPDVIVAVNFRLVQLGDKYLEAKQYTDALEAYSAARPRVQVIALQSARLEYMESRLAAITANIQKLIADRQTVPHRYEEQASILKAMIDNVKETLKQVTGIEQYDATLEYRIARCYFNNNRFWPATAAFEAVVADFPTFPDTPTALYGATIAQYQLGRKDATRALAVKYLDQNPTGKYVAQLSEINAVILLQQDMNKEAVDFLSAYLKSFPQTNNQEGFRALLANARFALGPMEPAQYDTAADEYDKLRGEFPNSERFEEYTYRRAMCDFLRNNYKNTLASFDAYEKAFPSGQFLPEVRYRRGIIQLAQAAQATDPTKQAALYKDLLNSMQVLVADPAADNLNLWGPGYTLMADAYSALGNNGDKEATGLAATAYANAVKNAKGDQQIIAYALDEATKMLRSARRWDDLTELWQKFLKDNPGHPMELRGVGELSKLLVRAKKIDEARSLLVQHILDKIDNPRSEYVEMLLGQLVELYVPKKVIVKKGETPPPPPAVSPEDELVKSLDIPEDQRTPTYVDRLLYAKAELARKMKDTEKNQLDLKLLATSANPDDLSPVLLKVLGDYLFTTGKLDEAAPFYIRLRDAFSASVYSESAPVGLGKIALAKKDYAGAIGFFDTALNNANVSENSIKEATFGKGQALFAMKNKNEEAKKMFDTVVGDRSMRGSEKAGSLFYLGEIEAASGNPAGANGFFQKVYTSYTGFPEWAAKSYIRSADMFEKVGDMTGSQNSLRQMVMNPKLANTPEVKEAKKRLGE